MKEHSFFFLGIKFFTFSFSNLAYCLVFFTNSGGAPLYFIPHSCATTMIVWKTLRALALSLHFSALCESRQLLYAWWQDPHRGFSWSLPMLIFHQLWLPWVIQDTLVPELLYRPMHGVVWFVSLHPLSYFHLSFPGYQILCIWLGSTYEGQVGCNYGFWILTGVHHDHLFFDKNKMCEIV